jgi:hypothetical protein
MKLVKFFLPRLLVVFFATTPSANAQSKLKPRAGWQAVYQHDENGKPLQGSIDALITAVRHGYNIRIGWGWQRTLGDSLVRLEHVAYPVFLSVIQEKHVSAVIEPHPLLKSYLDVKQQKFQEGGHWWHCVLTTQGTFQAQVYHRESGTLLHDWPQRQRMTWFVEYPPKRSRKAKPLFE